MKKFIVMLLAFAFVVGTIGCGQTATSDKGVNKDKAAKDKAK